MTGTPLDPAGFVGEIEAAARAGGWTFHYLSPCASSTRPWFSKARPGAPRFYLSTGIHGDETSGPHAVLKMLRMADFFQGLDVTLFPILNPDGLAQGTRTNAQGIDLNRDYRNTKSEEIRSHKEAVEKLAPFGAAMYLHEDFEGVGAYLYELNDALLSPTLGAEVIAAMSAHVPIDERPVIEDVTATKGVLLRRDILAKFGPIEDREEWAEALYMSVHHTKVSITTETPMPFPMENRVEAQIAAVSTLMDALRRNG